MSDKSTGKRLAFLTSTTFGMIVVAVIVIALLVALPRQVTDGRVSSVANVAPAPDAAVPVAPEAQKTVACDYAHVIGKQADQVSSDQLKGHPVRVVRKGMMVTMEYLEGRINLHVDDHGVITAVTCG